MRRALVLAAVFLGALLVVPEAPAGDGPSATEAAGKGGKAGKGKKCKKGQARVKSGKRTSCLRLPKGKATVTPRAEDPRLASIKAGLTPPILSAPDPKDQLPPSMEKVYRSFGPQALQGMETAVARSLPKLGAVAARPRLLARPATAWSSAGGGYSENIGGGMRIDIRLNIAKVASAEFALTKTRDDGRTLTVTYELPLLSRDYEGFHGDSCPNAEGKLKAKDGLGITVRSELRSNGGKTLDEYLLYKVVDKTELRAEVGDDAKLDRLEINNIQEVDETVFDSALYSGAQVKATIVREGTVDMRSGNLNTTINNVDAAVTLSGVASLFPTSARAGIVGRMKQAADEGWQAVVKVETDKFKELEKVWNEANKCAKIVFGKQNRTVTLHRNDSGSESARVDAKPGGSPSKATWEMKNQANASVTPPAGTANPNNFSYKVVHVGDGVEVKVTLKAVSKAGVAEESWIQKTEEITVDEIVGTFTQRSDYGGSVFEYAGNATFVRYIPAVAGPVDGGFKLVSGLFTFTASGNATQIGVGPKCSMRGSGQFALQKEGAFTVFSQKFDGLPPFEYTYSFSSEFIGGLPPMVEIETFACTPEASEWEGKRLSWPAALGFFTSTPKISADGITYAGTQTNEQGPLKVTETWSFEGKP